MKKTTPATDKVVAFLQAQKSDFVAHGNHRSKIAVIDRLIAHEGHLEYAWQNLLDRCPRGNPPGMIWERWQLVVDSLVDAAVHCTPEKIKASRDALYRIAELNHEIAGKASELVSLIRKRDALRLHGDISLPMDHTPLDLLQRAAELNGHDHTGYLFAQHIAPTLNDLQNQFDLKYWPTTADLFDALVEAQFHDAPAAQDTLTAAALQVNQASVRDFMRALDKALDGLVRACYVGESIQLSEQAYADICNALLGLDSDSFISASNVKTYRAYERRRKQSIRGR